MYTLDTRVRYSETDENSLMTIDGILNLLQDCSTAQSDDLGVGIDYLVSHRQGWVVNYWQIDIRRRPRLSEIIRTGTNPYAFKGFMGLRNFAIETAAGERLVEANSVWSLLDLEHMKPVKVPDMMRERYVLGEKFDMEYLPRKIAAPAGEGQETESVAVSPYDLDSNRHANNTRYVRWAIEAVTACAPGFHPAAIRRLQVEYKKQAFVGDEILPRVYAGENADSFTIRLSNEAGEDYALVCLN